MIVKSKKSNFSPVDITITFESQRELEFLWSLLNNSDSNLADFANKGIDDNRFKNFDPIDVDTYCVWSYIDKLLK